MKKSIYIFLWLKLSLIGPASVLAQPDSTEFFVGNVIIHGAHLYSKSKVQDILQLPSKTRFSLKTVQESINRILEHYQQDGSYFTAIDSVVVVFDRNQAKVNLTYFIDEQDRLSHQKIVLNTDPPTLKDLLQSLIDLRGERPIDQKLEANIDQLLIYLENNGYPFAQVYLDSVTMKSLDTLVAYLSISAGHFITVDQIKINGNKLTRDYVIKRELRIRLGEKYQRKKIARIPQRLQRLGYFKEVDEPQIALPEDGRGELSVNVVEGNMNRMDGVVGYNPGRDNVPGYFNGLIEISLANLLGTGRKVDAFWEKKDIKTQQLRFYYQEPWVAGLPIHVGGWFQQLIQDTTYIKRNWMFDINVPISENITIFTNMGREQISPDSIGFVRWQIPKSTSWLLNLGISFDTRDNLLNPTRGVFYQTTYELARKRNREFSDGDEFMNTNRSFNRKRLALDMELLVPAFKYQVISLALHGRQITSNEPQIAISDLFRLGGSRSLRGFREDEFLGDQIVWINVEYRYLLSPLSRAFLFFDGGYYAQKTTTNDKMDDYRMGYGLGIRVDTRLGIIGVDYGLSPGRGLSNGLVHVRLVSAF